MRKIVLAFLLLSSTLFAAEMGELSLYALKGGKPLQSEALIDDEQKFISDGDGYIFVPLSEGKHSVEMFSSENGVMQSYMKKFVFITAKKQTQLIISLKEDGTLSLVDEELPVANVAEATSEGNVTKQAVTFGTLEGIIKSGADGKVVVGARIFVRGSGVDAKTDKDGKFSVKIPTGKQAFSVIHSDFSAQTVNVEIAEGKVTKKEVELSPASLEMEEFVVLAPHVSGSVAAIVAEEKQSSAITNILGSEDMSKKGDSDAASALKRVTGVTLVGGKSIYVRGLGDRYSNVEMNSMPLPSPDPTRRVVPLDIFPSGVISSLKVQKSATADIPSSFGGGYVDVRTKDKADDNYIKLNISVKADSFTGKSVETYKGSVTDSLGYDDGYRTIPSEILDASKVQVGEKVPTFTYDQSQEYMKSIINRELTTAKETLSPGYSMGVEGAYNFEVADEHKITLFGNYKYKVDNKYRQENYYSYDYDLETDRLKDEANQYGVHDIVSNEYSNSGIFNVGYSYSDTFRSKYTKLYSKVSEKLTRISDGIAGSNDTWLKRYNLNWEERTLNVDQVSGDVDYNVFTLKSNMKFGVENATAKLYQPGNYKYAYDQGYGFDGVKRYEPFLDKGAANIFANMNSDDNLNALYLSNKITFELFNEDEFFDFGYTTSKKDKVYTYNKYKISEKFSDTNRKKYLTADIDTIYNTYVKQSDEKFPNAFELGVLHIPEDYFNALVNDSSFYLNTMLKPLENVNVLIGGRYVDFKQSVDKFTYGSDATNDVYIETSSLSVKKFYPSGSLKYMINDENHIDIAYSQTYVVPDLREFTDTTYFHPYDVAEVKGNPDLVNTDITSYDLKYSHYFSTIDSVKFGLFYKYLDKPIEDDVVPTSTLTMYSYHNADFAKLQGFEVDGRKGFGFIHSSMEDYYISGNFSYTDSDVTLKKEQEVQYTSNHRQLQGLSQVVMNVTFGYDFEGRSIALSYNKMGERIRKVGLMENVVLDENNNITEAEKYPDDIEIPPALLDFVWMEKYENGLTFKVKLGNLLDDETIWKQADKVTKRFKQGRNATFSMAYKF